MQLTRRSLLQSAGAGTVAAAGIAGCISRGSGSLDTLTVAYVPIYPNMQHYVMEREGFYEDVPTDVSTKRFNSGPSVVTAFASGDVDVALFGITPSMVLVDKGTNAGVLAANSRNGFKIVAKTDVVDLYEQEGSATFEQFEQENGRKLRFGAPPDGSVPDVVLRYWLQEDLGVGEMNAVIDKSVVPPARAVQTIQSGEIDATAIQEPFATIIARQEGYSELAWSGKILEDHPVTVLFASQQVIDESDISQSLVEQHTAATDFTANSPDAAASHAAEVIGSGVSERLAVEPEILLMDEPFGSVDARTRDRLHAELLDIWSGTGHTVVFVTHDIDEAVTLADRVVVMDADPGTVQSTVPIDLDRPRERTSHEFVEYVSQIRDELGEPAARSR